MNVQELKTALKTFGADADVVIENAAGDLFAVDDVRKLRKDNDENVYVVIIDAAELY